MAEPRSLTELAGIFAQLKLRLLINQVGANPWRAVFIILAAVFFAGMAVTGVAGAIGLRLVDTDTAGRTVVVFGSVAVIAWALVPLLMVGEDDTVDPARFALLPLSARRLAVGLVAASAVGAAPVATVLVSLATIITWSRDILSFAIAVPSAVLVALTCVIAGRATTSAAAAALSGRRGRETVTVLVVLGSSGLGLIGPVVAWLGATVGDASLEAAVQGLAWTPLGAAAGAPWAAADGRPLVALARLGIASATLVVLWMIYQWSLERRVRPRASGVRGRAGPATVRPPGVPRPRRRLFPDTPLGALAGRCLLYWRRDSRYAVSIGILPVLVLVIATVAIAVDGFESWALALGPFVATLLVLTMVNELSFDGSALWTTLAAGLPGRTERAARCLALLVWAAPLTATAALVGVGVSGFWHVWPTFVGGSLGLLLAGLGVAAVVSVVWVFPVPEAGANPFASTTGAQTVALLQQGVAMLAVVTVVLPILGLAAGSRWAPGLGWVLLVTGPVYGAAVLWQGVVMGGRRFDRKGPELLATLRR